MRWTIVVPVLFMSMVAPRAPRAEGSAPPGVRIESFAFTPADIRVKAGTAVEWVNRDEEPHTVTSDDDAFQSRALETGERFAFTFARKGRFSYHCALHPQMTGTVVVE